MGSQTIIGHFAVPYPRPELVESLQLHRRDLVAATAEDGREAHKLQGTLASVKLAVGCVFDA